MPPSYFEKKGSRTAKSPDPAATQTSEQQSHITALPEVSTIVTTTTEEALEPMATAEKTTVNTSDNPKTKSRRISGLSLNSIRSLQQHQSQKTATTLALDELPKDPFTEAQLLSAWMDYAKIQDRKGERILGSIFAMNKPLLKDGNIQLELPNGSMKIDIESAQAGLLQFLAKRLNHYALNLMITVNEGVAQKHAFTPQDKYKKLQEKNPLIDKLRTLFDLDF